MTENTETTINDSIKEIPYEIKLNNSTDKGMIVELEKVRELAIPSGIAISVLPLGVKEHKLSAYYASIFTNKDKKFDRFRYTICSIHKHAKQLKVMTILSNNRKLQHVHKLGFKMFMSENFEQIEMLAPYILNEGLEKGESSKDVKSVNAKTGDPKLDSFNLNGPGVELLSVNDVTQIKTLMKDIAEKEGLQLSPVEKVDDLTIEDEEVDVDTSFSKHDEV